MADEQNTGLAEDTRPFAQVDAVRLRCEELKSRFPKRGAELERAAEQINGKADLPIEEKLLAFERAADAITDGIKIFISYKSEDHALATAFKERLADYGAKRLKEDVNGDPEIFVAAQTIRGGEDWRLAIKGEIRTAHWLILLLPDVDLERDWLVWEAGYFDRGMHEAAGERLICVHHPNANLASQLENYQSYDSAAHGIAKLFEDLFFTPDAITGMDRVAPPFKQRQLADDAQELSIIFGHPKAKVEPIFCLKYIDIAHREGVDYADENDLLDATVLQLHDLKDVFNRDDSFNGTVGQLISDVHHRVYGTAWVGALARALRDVVTGRPPRPVVVPFFNYRRTAQFRPCLHCVRRRGVGGPPVSFHVVFIEEFGGQVVGVPYDLDALETAVRWSYRSWWEVLEPFGNRNVSTQEQLDTIRQYTERAEQEAQARNATDPALLNRVFAERPAEQAKLAEFQDRYYADYRDPSDEQSQRKIDRAFRDNDPALLGEALAELRPMVAWFLVHAARRYAELLAEKLKNKLPAEDPPAS